MNWNTSKPCVPFSDMIQFGELIDGETRFFIEQANIDERANDKRYAVLLWDESYGWWRADFETNHIAKAKAIWNKCKKLAKQNKAWSIMKLLLTESKRSK
jgi:hypothetical protein